MTVRRQQRLKKQHYVLLVNKKASFYQAKAIDKLIEAIRAKGFFYSLFEPESAADLLRQAEVAAGLRHATRTNPQPYGRGGPVTALIACGGDGTFNLVARAAVRAQLPVGCYPLGRVNNIARSLCKTCDINVISRSILTGGYREIDTAQAADIPFFGSLGLGFTVRLTEELEGRALPRFALGWSQIGAKAAAAVELRKTVVKVDAFRFEIKPIIFNINLLSYSAGLPLSPISIADDGYMEIIFDRGRGEGNFSAFTRSIVKGKYLYGDDIRLYRGKEITLQLLRGRTLYLDGELIELATDTLAVRVGDKQLRVLC